MDANTLKTSKFSKSQKQTIKACYDHAQSIFDVLKELEENGYATKPLIMKCPVKELDKILGETNPTRAKQKKGYVENKVDWNRTIQLSRK